MDWLSGLFSTLWGYVQRVISALRKLNFADIWNTIKRGWARFHQALQWYNDHVLKPFERMRQQLIAMYQHYFGPIIQLLDTLRSTVRVLAIFNRKLAQKLDSFFWSVESAIYAPLYSALRRLNAVTSTIRAIVTPLGLIDRSILIQSLERDWKSIWRVLLNNGQLPAKISTPVSARDWHTIQTDFDQYVSNGTGYYADTTQVLETQYQNSLTELS